MSKQVLRTPEAASYLGLAAATLEKMRGLGSGPKFIRLGRRAVGYRICDLDEWLDRRREETGPDVPPRPAA